jgi:hypothetical protein
MYPEEEGIEARKLNVNDRRRIVAFDSDVTCIRALGENKPGSGLCEATDLVHEDGPAWSITSRCRRTQAQGDPLEGQRQRDATTTEERGRKVEVELRILRGMLRSLYFSREIPDHSGQTDLVALKLRPLQVRSQKSHRVLVTALRGYPVEVDSD